MSSKKVTLFDTQLLPGSDLASSLSKLTGKSYENAIHELNRVDRPAVTDTLGNFSMRAFRDLASSHHASNTSIASEISAVTGRSFENVLSSMNMVEVTPLKK